MQMGRDGLKVITYVFALIVYSVAISLWVSNTDFGAVSLIGDVVIGLAFGLLLIRIADIRRMQNEITRIQKEKSNITWVRDNEFAQDELEKERLQKVGEVDSADYTYIGMGYYRHTKEG